MTRTNGRWFRIEELAEGVFAAVGDQEGLCHSNAGIVDLGEQTLVFDTLALPPYGVALAGAARDLTGREPSWIALSHYHADHLLGNQAFPGTIPLLATPAMEPHIEEWMTSYQGAIDDPEGFAQEIDDFASTCDAEENPARRAAMQTNLARYRALQKEIETLRLVRPNTLFEGTLRLVGSKRSVELVEVRNAHTASDVFLRLPDEGIVFLGDLGFFDTIPFLAYADPIHWAEVLGEFEASDMGTYVPGHGVVASVEKVRAERACIEAIVSAVREVLGEGGEITESLSNRLPEPFRTWAGRGRFNEMNYQAVGQHLSAATG